MKNYLENAVFLLGKTRREVPKIIFFFVLISILDLLGIGIIGPFLGVVFSGPDKMPTILINTFSLNEYSHTELVTVLAITMVVIYSVKSILGALIMRTVIRFSQNQQIHIREKLITSYQNMDYSKIIQRNSSELINAIQVMVPNYANLVMFVLQALGDSIVAIMIIVFLAWANPYAFGFLVLISGICLFGFDLLIRNRITEAGRHANEAASSIVGLTYESLKGFKEIRVLEKENHFKNNLVHNAEVLASANTSINFFSMIPKYIFEMIIIIFIAGISVGASFMVENPVDLIPTLGIFGMASIRMMPLARNFSFTLSRIRYTKDTVVKLALFLRESEGKSQPIQRRSVTTSTPFIDKVHRITLENISYTYPKSNKPALADISMDIKEGEHIGIVGTSGAGKTTLVDTLLGLLTPSKGRILINGVDITDHPDTLWQHVAYLPQEIFIIDGSVTQNIALGVPDDEVDIAKVNDAIMQAQIDDVIKDLPDGLESNLGENGVNLSGGQRQRIALARAFYFNRSILVLDEATSSLDEKTETQIVNYLKNLKKNITVISITHRANSLAHCDIVLKIKEGALDC